MHCEIVLWPGKRKYQGFLRGKEAAKLPKAQMKKYDIMQKMIRLLSGYSKFLEVLSILKDPQKH